MRWQKHLRLALAAVVVLLVAGIAWYATRERAGAAPDPVSPRTTTAAQTEIWNDEFSRTENGEVVFRIKYEHALIYEDGRVRLEKMTGTFAGRDAEPLDVTADEADLTLKSGAGSDLSKFDDLHMRGNVEFKGGDDLHMATSEAHYNDLSGVVQTDKAATIKRGNMSGSGKGMTFDRDRGVLWILANAKVRVEVEGQGPVDVTSSRAGLAQAENYMRFEEHVRMNRDGRVIQTDAARADLTPDGGGITKLELRGNSRITGGAANDGGVPNMAGDDISIDYSDETGLLEKAVLERAARVDLPGAAGRSLAGDFIDMAFAADGTTVTALDANGAVEMKVPAEGDDPATEIRAPKLVARGKAPEGLERATFSGGVEFREQLAAKGNRAAVDRLARSATLVLALDGGFDQIKDAVFSGNMRFRDTDMQAEAPDATYSVDKDAMSLRGGKGVSRVVQEDGTVQATNIDLTLDPRSMKARGNVRSTMTQGARKDRKEPRASILEDDEPVNVTAESLDYDGKTERAVYTGAARLWQSDTVIHGETIVLDDATGNLEAHKSVRTQFLIRDENAEDKSAKPKPTFGRGDDLLYVESRRQATFRGNAKITGPDSDIIGDRIELFLEEDGNTLERAEAYDNVTARLDGGRVATGSRLVYSAKTRRYDMQGAPLKVRRQTTEKAADGTAKTRCEETVGSALTFDRSADTVSVVGANGAPSRTVPVPCAPGGTRP